MKEDRHPGRSRSEQSKDARRFSNDQSESPPCIRIVPDDVVEAINARSRDPGRDPVVIPWE